MNLYNNFLKKTNLASANCLTEEKLAEILINEKFEEFFEKKSLAVELFDEILENCDSTFQIYKEIFSIRSLFNLLSLKNILKNNFEKYNNNTMDEEKFKNFLKNSLESEDSLFSLYTLSCILASNIKFLDSYISTEIFANTIAEKIKNIGIIFKNLGKIENSYNFRIEVIDSVFATREMFFSKFNKDFLQNIEWPFTEIDTLDEWENHKFKNKLPTVNILPEQLGFIDITKIKKE